MRHLYKLIEGNVQASLMLSILQKKDEFALTGHPGIDEMQVLGLDPQNMVRDGHGAELFPALRRLSLAILQMTDGVQLGNAFLLRLAAKTTLQMGVASPGFASYLMMLQAKQPGATLISGDEAEPARSWDIWWVSRMEAKFSNQSEDEAYMLLVEVRH